MSEWIEFGSKDAADAAREDWSEYVCPEDVDKRLTRVPFVSDTPEDVLDAIRLEAQDARTEQREESTSVDLTDDEHERIKELGGYKGRPTTFSWESAKGVFAREGMTDKFRDAMGALTDYDDPAEGAEAWIQNQREADATKGTGGASGGRRDEGNTEQQRQRKAGRAARRAQDEGCDRAHDFCKDGDEEACHYLREVCGYDEDEVEAILTRRDDRDHDDPDQRELVTVGGDQFPEMDVTPQEAGALKQSWQGYKAGISALAEAVEEAREEAANARQALSAINSIRESNGQDEMHGDRLHDLLEALDDLPESIPETTTLAHFTEDGLDVDADKFDLPEQPVDAPRSASTTTVGDVPDSLPGGFEYAGTTTLDAKDDDSPAARGPLHYWKRDADRMVGIYESAEYEGDGYPFVVAKWVNPVDGNPYWKHTHIAPDWESAIESARGVADQRTFIVDSEGAETYTEWVRRTGGTEYDDHTPHDQGESVDVDRMEMPDYPARGVREGDLRRLLETDDQRQLAATLREYAHQGVHQQAVPVAAHHLREMPTDDVRMAVEAANHNLPAAAQYDVDKFGMAVRDHLRQQPSEDYQEPPTTEQGGAVDVDKFDVPNDPVTSPRSATLSRLGRADPDDPDAAFFPGYEAKKFVEALRWAEKNTALPQQTLQNIRGVVQTTVPGTVRLTPRQWDTAADAVADYMTEAVGTPAGQNREDMRDKVFTTAETAKEAQKEARPISDPIKRQSEFAKDTQATLAANVDAEQNTGEKQVTLTGDDATAENGAIPARWTVENAKGGLPSRVTAGPFTARVERATDPADNYRDAWTVVLEGGDKRETLAEGLPDAETAQQVLDGFTDRLAPDDVSFHNAESAVPEAAAAAKKEALEGRDDGLSAFTDDD